MSVEHRSLRSSHHARRGRCRPHGPQRVKAASEVQTSEDPPHCLCAHQRNRTCRACDSTPSRNALLLRRLARGRRRASTLQVAEGGGGRAVGRRRHAAVCGRSRHWCIVLVPIQGHACPRAAALIKCPPQLFAAGVAGPAALHFGPCCASVVILLGVISPRAHPGLEATWDSCATAGTRRAGLQRAHRRELVLASWLRSTSRGREATPRR